MVPLSHVLTFAIAAALLIALPGPSVLFVVGRTLAHGRRAGLLSVVGNETGMLVQTALVALGVGAFVAQSIVVLTVIKFAGAAYLVFLGIQAIRHRHAVAAPVEEAAPRSALRLFGEGFVVGITNPKSIIFFVAILPQFIDVARPQVMQYVILAATTFAVDLATMMGYTALAAKVLRVMRDPSRLRWVNRGLGGAFIAAGVALASFRRAAHV
jgi:threonine/homoserine/homoserine lactone efflux protein